MKLQATLVVLTLVNLTLLSVQLARGRPAEAREGGTILRGRELQIVDDQGRTRASIKVHPANPNAKLPNGRPLPDTVILRLADPNGRPSVKLGTSVYGAGLALGGETDATYIQAIADGPESYVRLTNKAGHVQLIKP